MSRGTALTAADRAAIRMAMDTPMTDDEAISLIAELVLLATELMKVATPAQQRALMPTVVRAGNMAPYVRDRLRANADHPDAQLIAAARDMRNALSSARGVLASALRAAAPDMFESDADIAEHLTIQMIDAALQRASGAKP
ncbi:hypothetical protein [Luteimonas sp. FCS-9]|uniref:hypothetical protein n=1 Tax=Luteimonas sp. FCS-9 TaxID=1547516 RepID=UPI00063E6D2E|nr:hypothetical protein [Luteimonas sp. FCS-9]KLJ02851.1 hypothetical protein WQ56_00795 [Luteimonas sp. FCS-9]